MLTFCKNSERRAISLLNTAVYARERNISWPAAKQYRLYKQRSTHWNKPKLSSCSSYRATVIENARFLTLQLNHHDGRTNGWTKGRTKPFIQLRATIRMQLFSSPIGKKNCRHNFQHDDREERKQVTRGHDIVADGWAGVSNPHPNPTSPPQHTYDAVYGKKKFHASLQFFRYSLYNYFIISFIEKTFF